MMAMIGVTRMNMMKTKTTPSRTWHRIEVSMHHLQRIRQLQIQVSHILASDMGTYRIETRDNLAIAV